MRLENGFETMQKEGSSDGIKFFGASPDIMEAAIKRIKNWIEINSSSCTVECCKMECLKFC